MNRLLASSVVALVVAVMGGAGCGVEVRTYERESLSIHHIVVGVGNVWAIESHESDGFVLVDLAEKGDADEIVQGLAQLGRTPEDTVAIATHAHMDHAGPAKRLQEEGMKVALGAADIGIAESGVGVPGKDLLPESGIVRLVVDPTFPAWTPDIVLGDDELDLSVFGVPGRVKPMPGHTAGSVVVVLETGDAFVGDLVRGDGPWFRGSAHSGPNEGEAVTHFFSDDEAKDREHLDEVLGLGAKTIFPGHGPYFSADSLRGWLADRALELGEIDEQPAP